jgi:flagellar basal body-associated protein FliL
MAYNWAYFIIIIIIIITITVIVIIIIIRHFYKNKSLSVPQVHFKCNPADKRDPGRAEKRQKDQFLIQSDVMVITDNSISVSGLGYAVQRTDT